MNTKIDTTECFSGYSLTGLNLTLDNHQRPTREMAMHTISV
jgi:hypothetical protein